MRIMYMQVCCWSGQRRRKINMSLLQSSKQNASISAINIMLSWSYKNGK